MSQHQAQELDAVAINAEPSLQQHNYGLALSKQETEWLDAEDTVENDAVPENSIPPVDVSGELSANLEEVGISTSLSLDETRDVTLTSVESSKDRLPIGAARAVNANRTSHFSIDDTDIEDRVPERIPDCRCTTYLSIGESSFLPPGFMGVLRILFLFINAISIGFAYATKGDVNSNAYMLEIFPWLQLAYLFIVPVLIFCSILAKNWVDMHTLDMREVTHTDLTGVEMWAIVAFLFQGITCLVQVELVRLLVLHHFPALRPLISKPTSGALYDLRNPFAAQRYVLVCCTVADLLISTMSFRFRNVLCIVLFSTIFEIVMGLCRPFNDSYGKRFVMLATYETVLFSVGLINYFIWNSLPYRFHKRRRRPLSRLPSRMSV